MYNEDFKAIWTASARFLYLNDDRYHPKLALDNDYSMLDYVALNKKNNWLQIDFGATTIVRQVRLYPGTKG